MSQSKLERRTRIKKSIRKNIFGTAEKPRLSVYRSNKQLYAQIVDDVAGKTLVSCGSLKNQEAQNIAKIEQAKKVGADIAAKALEAGITQVVFDRNGYLYHGRVKSFAESAREGGLKF
jgi:large subunit ribosomal protein L18